MARQTTTTADDAAATQPDTAPQQDTELKTAPVLTVMVSVAPKARWSTIQVAGILWNRRPAEVSANAPYLTELRSHPDIVITDVIAAQPAPDGTTEATV